MKYTIYVCEFEIINLGRDTLLLFGFLFQNDNLKERARFVLNNL